MGDGGKGSRARPYSVDQKTFDANWDAIFGKNSNQDPPQPIKDDILKKEDKQNES